MYITIANRHTKQIGQSNTMVAFADLLEFGYFPRELPPVFTSSTFARALAGVNPPPRAQRSSELLTFSLSRVGGLRRQLSIPNPSGFALLALQISRNWAALQGHYAHDKVSITSPAAGRLTGRAVDPRFKLEALPIRRAITRAGARYLVQADVARFYSSIYTHTIPWAAHGKQIAKQRRRDRTLYGNLLDESVRKCQDDQTIGIPIGPDTSLVLAELILSKVDGQLRGIVTEKNAFRYIDDYEISCRTLRQAEESLAALDEALRTYELELNERKSRILELPIPLYDVWKDSLARFVFTSENPVEQREEIVRYFTTAFDLRTRNPDAYVLNYALSRFPIAQTRPSNWRLVESLLLQCLNLEPGATRYAAALSEHLREHASLSHGAEMAWTIWGATELKLSLSEEAVSAVSTAEDAVAALLALRAKREGVFRRGLKTSLWRPHMCAEGLYGPLWLLSYEANFRGWLPNVGTADYVLADPFFGRLKRQRVSFLDLSPVPTVARIRLGVRRASQAIYL